MDTPGQSLFHPDGLDIVHEVENEEQDDAEEAYQIEEKIDEGLSQEFGDMESIIDDDDDDDEEGNGLENRCSPPIRKFHKLIPENSPMQSTPLYGENQYLKSGDPMEDQKTLFLARGIEINRLNEEIQSLTRTRNAERNQKSHEINILEAKKNELMNNVEELNELLRGSSEENKVLREQIVSLKNEKDRNYATVQKTSEEMENSQIIICKLQSQVQQLQKSDALFKARQQHDAIVRSLKESHESEVLNLKNEVDQLCTQVRRQDTEVSTLKTKLLQRDLVVPSQEMEVRLREKDMRAEHLLIRLKNKETEHSQVLEEKNKMIMRLNARLDENHKRVSELISEKISTKQLENDIKIAEKTLKSLQKENEELRINTDTIQMKAHHFEALSEARSDPNDHMEATLQKATEDIIARDKEILSLKMKMTSLESEIIKSQELGVSEDFSDKAKSLTEELSRVTNKYMTLKRKVKSYQDHCQRKEKHYQDEMKRMEEEYRSTLLSLKSKMEAAYNTKEQEIEIELMEMKDHFYLELEKITSLDGKRLHSVPDVFHAPSISPDEFLQGLSESSSKKENTAPPSRLEEVDRFFAQAQEDAKKRIASLQGGAPRPFSTLSNNNA